jgi:hypothetical protein
VNDLPTNAASRLIAVLEAFKESRSESVIDAWSATLHAKNVNELFMRIADLGNLIETVRERVRNLPESDGPDFLLMGLEPLDEFFDRFQRMGMSTTKDRWNSILKPSVMQALSLCARVLRDEQNESSIAQSDLQILLSDIQEWIGEVSRDNSLKVHDKIFILRRLREVEAALLGFFMGGFDRLEAAVSALAGAALVCESARNRTFLDKVASFWNRVLSVAQGAVAISGAAEDTAKAIDAISQITH